MLTGSDFVQGPGVLGLPAASLQRLSDNNVFDVCVVGVPFDGGVTGVPGQRHGPELARAYGPKYAWSTDSAGTTTGPLDPISGRPVVYGIRVADLGDLGGIPLDPRIERRAYYLALAKLARRILPAVGIYIGGDHSITAALVEGAVSAQSDLSVVCFDAHCDYTGRAEPLERVTHADFLGRVGQLDGVSTVTVLGCRVPLPHTAYPLPDNLFVCLDLTISPELTGSRVWLSIDLDVLDPSQFPATGHPAPGGYTVRELLAAVRTVIRQTNIVGIDITEALHAPQHDQYTGSVIGAVVMACLTELTGTSGGTNDV